MKKIGKFSVLIILGMFLMTMLAAATVQASSDDDWYEVSTTDPPDNIYDNMYTYGKVGIGDPDPDFRLEVAVTVDDGYFGVSSAADNDGDIFIIDSSGDVGIGTTNPSNKLTVSGDADFTGSVGIGTASPQEELTLGSGSNFGMEMGIPQDVTANGAAGGSLGAGTYVYVVTALDGIGETISSDPAVETIDGTTEQSIIISWTMVTGASTYRVYGRSLLSQYWTVAQSTTPSYTDDGTAGTAGSPPSVTTAYVNKLSASGNSWILCGKLGIGTTDPDPAYELHVEDDIYSSDGMRLGGDSGVRGGLLELYNKDPNWGDVFEAYGATDNILFMLENDGDVGIGTDDPDERFEIEWSTNIDAEIGKGTGTVDPDITFIALRNADGEKCYIYPNAAQNAIIVSATKP